MSFREEQLFFLDVSQSDFNALSLFSVFTFALIILLECKFDGDSVTCNLLRFIYLWTVAILLETDGLLVNAKSENKS